MKAVITVTGKDCVGIIAKVSGLCAENGVNIVDITQKVLEGLFVMIMLVDISGMKIRFGDLVDTLDAMGKENGLVIHTMHEDIFNAMHTV